MVLLSVRSSSRAEVKKLRTLEKSVKPLSKLDGKEKGTSNI